MVPKSIYSCEGDGEGRQQVREGQVHHQDVAGIVDVAPLSNQSHQHHIQHHWKQKVGEGLKTFKTSLSG